MKTTQPDLFALDFNLASDEQADGARLLAEKLKQIEDRKTAKAAQSTMFEEGTP